MSFTQLGLSQTLNNHVTKHGYSSPTPIQAKAIPIILAGKDIMAAAQTGTGKNGGFLFTHITAFSGRSKSQS